MDQLKEKMLTTKEIFKGRVFTVRKDEVLLPNGKKGTREVVDHPGAIAVFAKDNESKIILVKQYRYALGKITLEIPAGKLEPGETPLECAQRELAEETGLQAKNWVKLTSVYMTPGFCNEIMHLYFASSLSSDVKSPDEDEFVEVLTLTAEEIMDKIKKGEIIDGKTILAFSLASLFKLL